MVKKVNQTTEMDVRKVLGNSVVESWNQQKVNEWLEQKGWGQFIVIFEKHDICRERFFQITLAELVEYLPRTITTYYERRRLLNEIRSLIPGQLQKPTPTTPTNISINTNILDYSRDQHNSAESYKSLSLSPHMDHLTRDSGIGYLSHYSAGSSTSSPTISPKSSSYSPKAAFNKLKNTFRSQSPRSVRHESGDEVQIPARVSSTPDKVAKFWSNYWKSNSPPPPPPPPKNFTHQKIQITSDTETWYSLNVTNMRDPVEIKKHILNRMNFMGDIDQFLYFHENGSHPDKPMDPQELMYLCSIADHSASHRILVKLRQQLPIHPLATPELGNSPTEIRHQPFLSPRFRPLARKQARRSVGIQLCDPPSPEWKRTEENRNCGLWAVQPQLWAVTPPTPTDKEFWGERPPAEVVVQNIEQYFDSQDLDKEVQLNNQRTKSIRVVAREASRKYNLARKMNMLRRKSTKLWGQQIIEAKRLPSVSSHINLSNSGTVQWIRGKLIGKGSFGRVYLAFNVATGEVIAVKQVEIPKTASDLLNEQQHDMVKALYQEIIMLRDLDHENIVQYLGYGKDEAEGLVHIFLEYVSGGSVSSRLALHGAFDEPLTKYFTRQICCGLEYLHSRNILHRDIKAANILVEEDGTCKISDFGLSKKNDYDEVYDENSRMSLRGSIYWMAPEVVKNEPYSAKVDIWSLGCTVIEMLTGQRPWITLNQIAALYNLGRLNSPNIPENISNTAKDFLKQCFIIDPLKRPTATDLLKHEFLQVDSTFDFHDYIDKGKI